MSKKTNVCKIYDRATKNSHSSFSCLFSLVHFQDPMQYHLKIIIKFFMDKFKSFMLWRGGAVVSAVNTQ